MSADFPWCVSCACVRFFQISASVAEIFLRKVKIGAHGKSRRWFMDRDAEFEASRGFVTSSVRTRRGQLLCRRLSHSSKQPWNLNVSRIKKHWQAVASFVFLTSFIFGWQKGDALCCDRVCVALSLGSRVGRGYFRLASLSLSIVTRRRSISPSYRPVDLWVLQHWESFSWSLPKPARLCKVSVFRRVRIQAIKSLQKKKKKNGNEQWKTN